MDWNAPAKLIAAVRDMPAEDRSRLLLDAGGQGTFGVAEIMALAGRADFPRG